MLLVETCLLSNSFVIGKALLRLFVLFCSRRSCSCSMAVLRNSLIFPIGINAPSSKSIERCSNTNGVLPVFCNFSSTCSLVIGCRAAFSTDSPQIEISAARF